MDFDVNKDYYRVLGIDKENATFDVIYNAWHRWVYQERVSYMELKDINEAYRVLSDSKTKKEYDDAILSKSSYKDISSFSFDSNNDSIKTFEFDKEDKIDTPENSGSEDEKKVTDTPENSGSEDEKEVTDTPENSGPEDEKEVTDTPENSGTEDEKEVTDTPENSKPEDIFSSTDTKKDSNSLGFPSNNYETNNIIVDKLIFKFKQATSIAIGASVGFALFGPLGAIGGGMLSLSLYEQLHMSAPKLKLYKNKAVLKIKDIKISISDKYKKDKVSKTNELDDLLNKPYNNYNLQIYKQKCINDIKLLESQISFFKNTKLQKESELYNELGYIALKNKLNLYKQKLSQIEKKISEYHNKQLLTKTNEKLENELTNFSINNKSGLNKFKFYHSVLKFEKKYVSLMKYSLAKRIINIKSKLLTVKNPNELNDSDNEYQIENGEKVRVY